MYFGRVLTAMVTPFDAQGEIDYENTGKLIDHLIQNGTDAIVVAGTTGECPTLSTAEKIELFSFAVEYADGRIPVIAGTGSNNTRESVALTIEAENCGVDGVMLVTPYYNKPSQEGMYQHFKAIAENTTLPVMLYNVPGRTASTLQADTVIRLANDIENITCLKDASGDLEAITKVVSETSDDFFLYSGEDAIILPTLAVGGVGVVSVASHIVGLDMQAMIQAYEIGRVKKAAQIHQELLPTCQAIFSAPSPTPLKAVLNANGVNVGSVRLPLVPLNDEERKDLFKKLHLKVVKVS